MTKIETLPQSPTNPHIFEAPAGEEYRPAPVDLAIITAYIGHFADTGEFYGGRAYDALAQKTKENVDLQYEATHDYLTGLPNRRALMDHLQTRTDPIEGMLFIDLDGFKMVNDTDGHLQGDKLLQVIGARLDGLMRDGDFVARLGGDEFVVVLGPGKADERMSTNEHHKRTQKSQDQLVDGAEGRFITGVIEAITPEVISNEVVSAAELLKIQASIGASTGDVRPRPGEDPLALLKRADDEMYLRKQLRRKGLVRIPGANYTNTSR